MKPQLRTSPVIAVVFLVLATSFLGSAQVQQACGSQNCIPVPKMDEQTAAMRQQAMALQEQMRYGDAIPLFEKVLAVVPGDVVAQENFAIALFYYADTLKEQGQRKAARIRALKEFRRAKELGDNSDLAQLMLAGLPEDGHDPSFSQNAEVDGWMKKGDAAFSAGKLDEAIDDYIHALELDPRLYSAALFVGDVHFRKGEYSQAGEWFRQAIQINPSQETAYRYWGDALLKEGRFAAAREKFIGAVICNPYDQRTWSGVNNFLRAVNKPAVFKRVKSPVTLKVTGSDNDGHITNANVVVPPNMPTDDGSTAWLGYVMIQNSWRNGKFAQEYPNEKEYRHSLKEEAFMLSTLVDVADKTLKPGQKLNPDLEFLASLKKQALLEPYILISAADAGIVKDYAGYRAEHRDLLVRYLSDVVLPAAPADRPQ